MEWQQGVGKIPRGSLLFANGRGDFIEKYLEPLGHWHAAGWNVTAFDWRGQGGSRWSIEAGHLDSFDEVVADGAALMGKWIAEHPGPHVAIGHSMGGHLLLRILTEKRPAIAAAVLVAPMIGINASPIPHWLGRALSGALSRLGLRRTRAWKHNERPTPVNVSRQAYLTSCPDRYSDELWWKERESSYSLGPPTWGWLSAAYGSIAALTPQRLRAVQTPILILGTDTDRLVSPNAIRRAARLLPQAELHMFKHAGHELLRESDPVRLESLGRIDEFLDRHSAR